MNSSILSSIINLWVSQFQTRILISITALFVWTGAKDLLAVPDAINLYAIIIFGHWVIDVHIADLNRFDMHRKLSFKASLKFRSIREGRRWKRRILSLALLQDAISKENTMQWNFTEKVGTSRKKLMRFYSQRKDRKSWKEMLWRNFLLTNMQKTLKNSDKKL